MASAKKARSSRLWLMLRPRRRREVPWGTVGGRTAETMMPCSANAALTARVRSASPRMTGRIWVVELPMSCPAAWSVSRSHWALACYQPMVRSMPWAKVTLGAKPSSLAAKSKFMA